MARKQHMGTYGGNFFTRPPSWTQLVAEYVRNELKSSSEDLDRRPHLQVCVGREPTDLSHRMDDPSAIVCLKRGVAPHLVKGDVPQEQRKSRPPIKKRKIVFDSGDLGGMLGG